MIRHRLSPLAKRDLRDIRDWIAQDNPTRAVSFVAELTEHLAQLARNPLIGRARQDLGTGYRPMPHGNVLIVYRPAKHGIDVLRVVHGRRDMSRGLH